MSLNEAWDREGQDITQEMVEQYVCSHPNPGALQYTRRGTTGYYVMRFGIDLTCARMTLGSSRHREAYIHWVSDPDGSLYRELANGGPLGPDELLVINQEQEMLAELTHERS